MNWKEGQRKLAHMAAFWPALFLPWLTPGQAISIAFLLVLMNAFILPRFAPGLYRPHEPGLGALEIILYPCAVMACIVAFGLVTDKSLGNSPWYLPVGAAWFGLSFVDACIGSACRWFPHGPRLPWNQRKPIFAVILGVITACLPAWGLAEWALPAHAQTWGWSWLFGLVAICALAETAWFGIADNIIIPFSLCVLVPFIPSPLFPSVSQPLHPNAGGWLLLLVPLAFAAASWTAGLLTWGGALLGGLLAFLLIQADPVLFAFMGGFFVLGNLATRFGFQSKFKRGIAEARGGKRGAAEVFGAMGVAAWMTPLVHLARTQSSETLHHALLICIVPLAAKTMDTVSSEIGKALAGRTFSLKSFQMVPSGTKGGVSVGGTVWGLLAALALCLPVQALGWGNWGDVTMLMIIALAANLFEAYWSEWAGPKGMDQGAHTNVLMTLMAAVLAWIIWVGRL